jgi:hypothetical protein
MSCLSFYVILQKNIYKKVLYHIRRVIAAAWEQVL